jgi:hypothetical protein
MSRPLRILRWKPRRDPIAGSIDFRGLGWLIRRVAVWQTLFGWHRPWMRPALAELFLRKNWKHLECAARKQFAYDVAKRWQP